MILHLRLPGYQIVFCHLLIMLYKKESRFQMVNISLCSLTVAKQMWSWLGQWDQHPSWERVDNKCIQTEPVLDPWGWGAESVQLAAQLWVSIWRLPNVNLLSDFKGTVRLGQSCWHVSTSVTKHSESHSPSCCGDKSFHDTQGWLGSLQASLWYQVHVISQLRPTIPEFS